MGANVEENDLSRQVQLFVEKTSGLSFVAVKALEGDTKRFCIQQVKDEKQIMINASDLEAVLYRADLDGREFIQVNFASGEKILITDTLIGFKPKLLSGLEEDKLPKVVTTPDLENVYSAIQDHLLMSPEDHQDFIVLRKIFEAILLGGESVGFDMNNEKEWLQRLPSLIRQATA